MMGHAEARRTEGASGGIAPTRFTLVLCVLLLVSLAAPGASALAQGQGRLVLTSNGLPKQIKADVILRGKGAKREVRFSGSRALHLAVGGYSVLVRPATARQSGHGLQKGAIAYPERKRIKIAVKSGTAAELKVGYRAVVNPGVKPLSSGTLEVIGEPGDPSAIVFSARTRQPAVGTIFMAAPSPQLPHGLISKVTSVKRTGSRTRVSLRAVPVTEAVPNLEFNGSVALEPVAGALAADSLHLAGGGKHASASKGSCSAPKLIKIGAHLDSFELRQASIGTWPPQMRLTLAIRTTESFGATAVAAGINCDWTLAELGPYQAAIPVGPIVIPVYATLPVNVGAQIDGQLGAATVNVASTTVATAAAGFDENKASLTQQGSNVWTSGSLSLSGSAKLSASVGVQAGIGVVKGGNVHVNAGFGPEFDWTSGQDCELRLNLGSLSAGVTIIGKTFDTPIFTPLHPRIWSGCQSASGGGGGSSPGGGGGGGKGGGGGGSGPPGGEEGPGGEEAPTGSGEYRVMIATLSGGTWNAVAVPRSTEGPEEAPGARNPACTNAGTCVVVSGYYISGTPHGWLNTYSDGTWLTEEAPLPLGGPPEVGEELGEPACAATVVCVVPGSYHQGYGMIETLAGGSWSAIAAPIPSNGLPNSGVVDYWSPACSSTGVCVLPGEYVGSDTEEHGMIETLNGGTWRSVEAPVPVSGVAGTARLRGAACGSGENCLITGSYKSSDGEWHDMVARLHSGAWEAIEVPIPSGATAGSGSVTEPACSWTGPCVVVGDFREAGTGENEVMIDNFVGGTWNSVVAPLPEHGRAGSGQWGEPTCSPGGTCAIAGEYEREEGGYPAVMVDVVTNSSLSATGMPDDAYGFPSAGTSEPACASSSDCVVVSFRHDYNDLVYSWINGSVAGNWISIEPPVPAGGVAGSGGLSGDPACSSDGTCVLAGGYRQSGEDHGMIATRSAAGDWTASDAPVPLQGVEKSGYFELHNKPACSSGGLCVLVGEFEATN